MGKGYHEGNKIRGKDLSDGAKLRFKHQFI